MLLYILRLVAVGGKGGRLARSEVSNLILNILNSSLLIFVFLANMKGDSGAYSNEKENKREDIHL